MPGPGADPSHADPAPDVDAQAEPSDDARAAASLAKDVAKWSVDRHTRERIEQEEFEENKIIAPPPRPKAKPRAAVPAPAVPKPAIGEKKPFTMSFGGISNEDYIASLRAKGRR